MTPHTQFEDRRLREAALRAFTKALHADRMVAITGAMATQALGYPKWSEFIASYALIASHLAAEIGKARRKNSGNDRTNSAKLLTEVKDLAEKLFIDSLDSQPPPCTNPPSGSCAPPKVSFKQDSRVSMWIIYDTFKRIDTEMDRNRAGLVIDGKYQSLALKTFEQRFAAIFQTRTEFKPPTKDSDRAATVRPLISSLGIKRVATLNYDMELERAFMLRHDERELLKFYEGGLHKQESYRAKIKDYIGEARRILQGAPTGRRYLYQKSVNRLARFAAKYTIMSEEELRSLTCFVGPRGSGRPIVTGERSRLSRTLGNGVAVESDVVNRERSDRLFEFAIGSAEIDRHIMHLHGRANATETMIANIRQYDRQYRLDDLQRDPFDHGLRMLIGGNPVLFLGVGMTEKELNDILQYFVSNSPIRRPAPMFVIWNTPKSLGPDDAKQYRADMRLDFLVRLAVHVLFDDDIGLPSDSDPLKALPETLKNLPQFVQKVDAQRKVVHQDWRSIDRRLDVDAATVPHRMWGSLKLREFRNSWRHVDADKRPTTPPPFDLNLFKSNGESPTTELVDKLIFAESRSGYGRGALSEYLIGEAEQDQRIGEATLKATKFGNRLLVNAGFSYDSDTLMSGIARFLGKLILPRQEDINACRSRYSENGVLISPAAQTLIIINGMDRFFGFDGTPLSAEFDQFLRCVNVRSHNLQIVLLGTLRMRPYCEMLKLKLHVLPASTHPGERTGTAAHGRDEKAELNSVYLEWVRARFEKTLNDLKNESPHHDADLSISDAAQASLRRAGLVDRATQNKAFFEAYMSPTLMSAMGLNCAAIFEILRTLSFVGAPMEAVMLMHAPKVRAILAECHKVPTSKSPTPIPAGDMPRTDAYDIVQIKSSLAEVLRSMCELGLLLRLDPHQPGRPACAKSSESESSSDRDDDETEPLWNRYGLHRSLATFLRERHGAPINDAKLATTFNISLFMSEPTDANTPEPSFHGELGTLVDNLIGAWHDITLSDFPLPLKKLASCETVKELDDASATLYEYFLHWPFLYGPPERDHPDLQRLFIYHGDKDRAIESLLQRAGRVSAVCLRAAFSIVRGYYSTGALLKFDGEALALDSNRDGALTEHAQRIDRLITGYHQVAAARRIVRDMLSAARAGLSDWDEKIGEEGIDHCLGPEPLYADDLVWLFNERATVALTQGHLFDARDAITQAEELNDAQVEKSYHGHNWRRIQINKIGLCIERGSLKPAERILDKLEHSLKQNPPWLPDRDHTPDRIEDIRTLFGDIPAPALARGTYDVTREEMLMVAMLTCYRGLIAHLRGRYHDAKPLYLIGTRMLRQLGEQRAYAHFQRQLAELERIFGNKQEALRQIDYAIAAAQAARQMDILYRARVVRADLIRQTNQDQAKCRYALEDIKDALRYAVQSDCYRLRIESSASLARNMRIGGDYDTALRYATEAMTIAARYGHSLQKTNLRIDLGRILEARGDPKSGKALIDQAIAIGTSKGYNLALERARHPLNPSAATNWVDLTASSGSQASP